MKKEDLADFKKELLLSRRRAALHSMLFTIGIWAGSIACIIYTAYLEVLVWVKLVSGLLVVAIALKAMWKIRINFSNYIEHLDEAIYELEKKINQQN